MMRRLAVLIAIVVGAVGAARGSAPQLATRDVRDFVGREFTVCGRVVAFDCSKSGDTVLLDLDDSDDSGGVSVGVRSAQRASFGERFEDPLQGAEVCATGRVERLLKRYVVVLDTPTALTVQKPGDPDAILRAKHDTQPCGGGIQIPKLTRDVKPMYTPDAMRAKIQGTVVMEAVVLSDGRIGDVRIVSSLDQEKGLDAQAVKAAKQWQFKPGLLRGRAVPMTVTIQLKFTLR